MAEAPARACCKAPRDGQSGAGPRRITDRHRPRIATSMPRARRDAIPQTQLPMTALLPGLRTWLDFFTLQRHSPTTFPRRTHAPACFATDLRTHRAVVATRA